MSRIRLLIQRHRVRTGALILTLCAVALYCVFTRRVPLLTGGGGRSAAAVFAQADQLHTGDPVRVHGVAVGDVSAISLQPDTDTALVHMHITDSQLRLTNAATATLRWGTLLGGSAYVDLDPGSGSVIAHRDPVIPLARTSSQVGFDQLNNIFSGDTSHEAQVTLAEFDRALSSPSTVGGAIDTLSPTLRTVNQGFTPLLGSEPGDLARLVTNTAHTVDGLGRDPSALRELVAGAAQTLQVTADKRNQLAALFDQLPGALASLRITSGRIDRTLRYLDPLVVRLQPGARELGPATQAAIPAFDQGAHLLAEAEPLLRELPGGLRSLGSASSSGVRLIGGLTPTLNRLHSDTLPWLAQPDPDTGIATVNMIGPTAAATDSAASEFDGISNWLHFAPEGDERSALDSPCQPFLTDPSASQKLRCQALDQVINHMLGVSVGARSR